MPSLNAAKLAQAKSLGFSDRQIAHLTQGGSPSIAGFLTLAESESCASPA
jgi:hypothetical protein